MNKRVLQALIALIWVFFIGFAILKIFFPEQMLVYIENEKVIQVGNFIDSHIVWTVIANTILSYVSAHFYFCACKQCWKLTSAEYRFIFLYVLGITIGYQWNAQIIAFIELGLLIVLPLLLRSNWKQIMAVFLMHQAGQLLTLFVRNEPLYLNSTNYAVRILLVLDVYIWLLLYYLYSNLYKEETLWAWLLSPFSVIFRKRNSKKNSQE